jgi:hypothetical protein
MQNKIVLIPSLKKKLKKNPYSRCDLLVYKYGAGTIGAIEMMVYLSTREAYQQEKPPRRLG